MFAFSLKIFDIRLLSLCKIMMALLLSEQHLEVASHVGINFLNYRRHFSIQTCVLFIGCQQHYHLSMARRILGFRPITQCAAKKKYFFGVSVSTT